MVSMPYYYMFHSVQLCLFEMIAQHAKCFTCPFGLGQVWGFGLILDWGLLSSFMRTEGSCQSAYVLLSGVFGTDETKNREG